MFHNPIANAFFTPHTLHHDFLLRCGQEIGGMLHRVPKNATSMSSIPACAALLAHSLGGMGICVPNPYAIDLIDDRARNHALHQATAQEACGSCEYHHFGRRIWAVMLGSTNSGH